MTHANIPDSDVYIELRRRGGPSGFTPPSGQTRDAEFQAVGPARRRRRVGISLGTVPLDGVYAFTLGLAMLFVQQAGAVSGALMAVLPLIFMVLRRRIMVQTIATRWPILLAPAIALLSVLWSEAPGVSAKYGIEMWLTAAAGIGLAVAVRPEAVLKGLCLAFAVNVGIALALGHSVAMGMNGQAFSGLSDGKNLLADIASTGGLLSLTVAMIAVRQKRIGWWLLAMLAAATEFYAVFLARSAGAVLALTAGVCALTVLAALQAMSRTVRIGVSVIVVMSAGILIASIQNIVSTLVTFGAHVFDKDSTLTGRTYLWYRASDLIAQKPWFGRGFYAFWRQGNIDAEGLWRFAGIVGRGGFNFHNALVELTVQLGFVGAAVFGGLALVGLLCLVRKFVERPSLPLCFWIAFFVYALIRAPIEAVGYAPFYFSTALLFAAVGAGLEPLPRPASTLKYRSQAMRLQAAYAGRQGSRAVQASAPLAR